MVNREDTEFHVPFFDAEGSVLDNDSTPLIHDGVIVKGYADKKNSKLYNIPNTSSAYGEYDDVPTLEPPILSLKCSDKKLDELIGNEPVILCVFASGGDCTNEGDFATPVQMSFLYQNGKYLGRLPEYTLRAIIYDIFGDNYVGYSEDKPFFGQHALVTRMKVIL